MVLKKTRNMAGDALGCDIQIQAYADRMRCRTTIGTAKALIALYADEPDVIELCEGRIREAEKMISEIDAFIDSEWMKTFPRFQIKDEAGKEKNDEC